MVFFSHKGILLKDHLKQVGFRSKIIINAKVIDEIDNGVLGDISYLIGISHDFGKYTTFFQKKLDGLLDNSLANHSLISAFFTYFTIGSYVNKRNLNKKKPYKYLPLLSYFIVKHHHGNLKDIFDDCDASSLFRSGYGNIKKQIDDIFSNSKLVKTEYDELLEGYSITANELFDNLSIFSNEITNSEEIKEILKPNIGKTAYYFKKEPNIVYYLLSQLLYSVLIDSDKKHAGSVRTIQRKELDENLVDSFLNKVEFQINKSTPINKVRNEIRKSVLKNLNIRNRIFTLTAPTGTGKTLTSFAAGLKLRKLLKNKLNLADEPRIIYTLPFTSIIDQSFNVFDQILEQIPDFKNAKSEYLLKHHYLSEIFYKTQSDKEKEEVSIDESLALVESWESEIIVTTFIQLFHTLIGNKNRSLKKFHNIVNSIIILDEVQNIPIEYWNVVRHILIALTKYYNCRIILMTATKPLIFNYNEYQELVNNHESFFKAESLNRVTLRKKDFLTIQDLYNNVSDNLNKDSYLFVFNTINSSLDFYNKIKNIDGYEIFYLSTNIIPKVRKNRIEEIKALIKANKVNKDKKRFIVITTQLIEAGVDIDCEVAYRDMGPLDSIIQVAGRCNRNNDTQNSDVFVMHLKDDKREYAQYIYSPVLLKITSDLLNAQKEIPEKYFLQIINKYFEQAKKSKSFDNELINSINTLYFYDKSCDRQPVSCFKLIKDNYIKYDVFVETDDQAKKIWKKFEDLKNIDDSLMRKNEFYKFKKEFYDYVISLPKRFFKEPPENIYHLSKEKFSQSENEFYNNKTGFDRTIVLPIEHTIAFI